jgi:hypothetical protein
MVGRWAFRWWIPWGWPLGSPLAIALPDRTNDFLRAGRDDHPAAWLHQGFIKKTRATPDQELDLAKRRKREVQKQSPYRK